MTSLALVVVLSAAPIKLALTNFTGVGFPEAQTTAFAEHLATGFHTASVVTAKDMAGLLGLERQKQLLGCSDSSCTGELASALGVDAIVQGELTRVGSVIQLNVKALAANDGRRLGTFSERLAKDEEVFAALDRASSSIEEQVLVALGVKRAAPAPSGGGRAWALLPLGVAVLAGVGGGVLMGAAGADYATLTNGMAKTNGLALVESGELKQGLAIGAFGLAGVGAVVAVLVFALSGAPPPVTVSMTGTSISLVGVWP